MRFYLLSYFGFVCLFVLEEGREETSFQKNVGNARLKKKVTLVSRRTALSESRIPDQCCEAQYANFPQSIQMWNSFVNLALSYLKNSHFSGNRVGSAVVLSLPLTTGLTSSY